MFVVVISIRDYFCSSQQYLSVIGCFQVRNFNFCYPTMEKRSLKFYDLRRKLDHGLWRILFRKVLNVNCAACLDESAYTCKYMGLSRGGWGGGGNLCRFPGHVTATVPLSTRKIVGETLQIAGE